VPQCPGIYLFWSGRLCVYVGQAKNLQDRLLSHWRRSHSDEINLWVRALGAHLCISYELVEANLGKAEQQLIDRYSPHLNKINARKL
jgi:excinuclease UvrABC nuclease subunit